MSLEMSKFYAGAHGIEAYPHFVEGNEKRQLVTTAYKTTLSNSMVSSICEGETRAAVGLTKHNTAPTSRGIKTELVGAAPTGWTTGSTILSRYKNAVGSGSGALTMKNRRKHVTHQHHLTQQKCQKRYRTSHFASCDCLREPDFKWIMRPLRKFKSGSDSSSESNSQFITLKYMGKLGTASPNLTVKTSWPNEIRPRRRARAPDPLQADMNTKTSKHSRVFCVPSQRIMLVDQLKQAQVRQLKAKRVRSQHREQQHPKPVKHERNQHGQPEKALLLQTDDVVETTSVHNSKTGKKRRREEAITKKASNDSNQKVSISSNSISSGGSYQTTIACSLTSCNQSDSIGKMWCSGQTYDTPIIEQKGNYKSLKLTSTVIKIMRKSSVENSRDPAITVQPQVYAAVRQLPQLPKVDTETALRAPKHKAQSECLPQMMTQTPIPKIIRVKQHKVPRTMEDGIDMSYQYFVSTPLKRGKRPQTIRYLYRPMVRSLNNSPTSTKHPRKSKKNQPNLIEAENNRNAQKIDMEMPQTRNSSTVFSILEPELKQNYQPPPLKLKAKYRPLLEKLSRMPFPTELPKEHRKQSGSGDAYLERLALPPVWIPAPKSVLQSQDSEIHPSLLEYQPNATRLNSKSGAYISYHAPLHFQRMNGDGETDGSSNPANSLSISLANKIAAPPSIAAVTYEDIELQINSQQQNNTSKSVSFQLNDLCSSSVGNSSNIAFTKKPCKKKKTNINGRSRSKVAKNAKSKGRK